MKKQKSVALLVETSNAYARNLLSGIVSYIRTNESWSVYLPEQHRGATPPSWLKSWKGDGLIVRTENEAIARAVRRLKMPIVDVSAARHVPGIPWVETDDGAIAELAFEHFHERGFEHYAFCGEPEFNWSNWREETFVAMTTASGRECSVFHAKSRHEPRFSLSRERTRLANWILSLPRPVAVFACYDIKAQQILDVCREHRIKVPEELALLGVDNDELLCDLCTPPLSSVIPAAHKTGREAARLLNLMMNHEKVDGLAHLIEPIGIATRQSTDILAIDDPEVAAAMRFIRDLQSGTDLLVGHRHDGVDTHPDVSVWHANERSHPKSGTPRSGVSSSQQGEPNRRILDSQRTGHDASRLGIRAGAVDATGDQGGTQSVTVRATNAGGTADLAFDVLTMFTAAVTNVEVTGTTLLVPTAHWAAPSGEGAGLVDSYLIQGTATWGVGRTKQTHRVSLMDQRPDPSTMELVSGPSGLTFDLATETAIWTPGATDVTSGYSTTSVTFRATNEVGSVDVHVPIRVATAMATGSSICSISRSFAAHSEPLPETPATSTDWTPTAMLRSTCLTLPSFAVGSEASAWSRLRIRLEILSWL